MADKHEQIWTLMGEIETAMIVTHAGDALRARPMVARPEREHNAIYFLTDANAPKDQEIEQDAKVCLTFSDTKANRYVSVTGSADVLADPALVESLWKTAEKAFWKSPQDPQIRVIRVTPDRGEYWEGAGMISTFVNVIAAGAKGERPKLGENAKVAM
jgi:general stress protein 26